MNEKSEIESLKYQLATLEAEYQEFAYIVSHDLSEPFRTMEGFSSIILEKYQGIFDDKTKKHFDLIINSTNKGQRTLKALLEFSRLKTATAVFVSVDCNDIVKMAKEMLSHEICTSQAQVYATQLPLIIVEKKQITRVFYHLIKNALTYQVKGKKPKITISVEEQARHWQFAIKDNGIGIHEKMKEKIFNPLRRGVKDHDYPGMGIGLALCRDIVRRHKGNIYVKTEDPSGSTFYFTLSKYLEAG